MNKQKQAILESLRAVLQAPGGESFTLDELTQACLPALNRKKVTDKLREEVEQLLAEEMLDELLVHGNDSLEPLFASRQGFFTGAHFMISVTPLEATHKCLIPGHRFLPFVSPALFPPTCELYDGERTFEVRKKTFQMRDVAIFLSLYGEVGTVQYLLTDDALDSDEMYNPSPDSEVNLSVFDCKQFFEKNNIQAGDRLLVRVLDYALGDLIIEKIIDKNAPVDFININCQVKLLDEYLEEVFDQFGPINMTIERQLEQAIFYAGDKFITKPAFHVGGYLQYSEKVTIKRSVHDHILWYRDEDPMDSMDLEELAENTQFNELRSMVDHILNLHGIPLTEGEIVAYLMNYLYEGGKDSSEAVNCVLELLDEDAEDEDFGFLEEVTNDLFEEVVEDYNPFKDGANGELRNRLLQVNTVLLKFKQAAEGFSGEELAQLGHREVVAATQMRVAVHELLLELNNMEFSLPANEVAMIESRIEEMLRYVEVLGEMLDDLRVDCPKTPKMEGPVEVYHFKVALDDKKRVYRRILIRGDQSLLDLHQAIFEAFDRFDPHLFSFFLTRGRTTSIRKRFAAPEFSVQDGGEIYDLSPNQSGDATKTYVQKLGLREQEKMYYLFDFGDEWWHEITLEKVELLSRGSVTYPLIAERRGDSPPQYPDLFE